MKACHILFNPFTVDARVQKELRSIEKLDNIKYIHILCTYSENLPKKETFSNRVNVERIFSSLQKSSFLILRIIGFLILYIKFLIKIIQLRPDIIHCHDLNSLPVGFCYKFFRPSKLIYDAHEFETEVLFNRKLKKLIALLAERIMILKVDHLISVSNSILQNYTFRYGKIPSSLIMNLPYMKKPHTKNHFREKYNLPPESIIVLYQGMFIRGRGIEKVIQAIKRFDNKLVHFVFMGQGDLESYIKTESLIESNIHFQSFVSNETVLEYTASADIGLCLIENCCKSYYFCLPNKFFEYIVAGIPVLATDLFELKNFITREKVGIVVDEKSYDLNLALNELNHDKLISFKENCKNISEKFCWENQERKILSIYIKLCTE